MVARDKHKWESLVMNFYVQLFVLRKRIFWTNIFLKWNISNQVHVLVFCFWLGMPYVPVNDFSFKGCNFTNCKVIKFSWTIQFEILQGNVHFKRRHIDFHQWQQNLLFFHTNCLKSKIFQILVTFFWNSLLLGEMSV